MSGRPPPARPTPEQAAAAASDRSVWVDANAGTGKTRVLTDRVLRLLLDGAPPAALLCLTYTKAAASEMLLRVGDRLALWATLDDAGLGAEIEALGAGAPTARRLAKARSLHDAVLALPGGLAIMTLHGLGQQLLRRFPLEAGVAASFEVIDDRTRRELLDEAREQVLRGAAHDPERAADLDVLAATAADTTVLDAVEALISERLDFARLLRQAGGLEALLGELASTLGVLSDQGEPALRAGAAREHAFDRAALAAAAGWLGAAEQKTRREVGAAIAAWLALDERGRAGDLDAYTARLTVRDKGKAGGLRASGHLKLPTLAAEAPGVAEALVVEIERLAALDASLRARRLFERTRALLRFAASVLDAFARAKAQRAVLDFDDLLLCTQALLAEPGAGDWVRYKMDQAFTHILVDEAQDTNPLQWAIVEQLLAEVFVGAGTRAPGGRTLFVVSDAKQSIFRFQGADPEASALARQRIEARAAAAGQALAAVALTTSFRSSQAVLDTVDALLADPDAVARLGPAPAHRAFEVARGGRVEVWPLLEPGDSPTRPDPWAVPPPSRHGERAERQLARHIAEVIAGWLEAGVTLPGSGRPLRPGDVMVLLRRREPMQAPLVRALKRAGVQVAGADRLALTDHLAVQDLVNLGRSVLLPEDDFALACALKSPLLGLDEDALFALAHGRRRGESLLERLRVAGEAGGALGVVWQRWRYWQRLADFVPAYEFYLRILGGEVDARADTPAFEGRRALLERFGDDAAETIDAFVEQALAHERGHPATLEGFLHWLERSDTGVKREAEAAGDAVRVLTVHGAKGLEAPLVVLADAGPRAAARARPLLWTAERDLVFWRPPADGHVTATRAARDAEAGAEQADDMRLLYVAATRAAEWLVVCGVAPKRAAASGRSWHDRLTAALNGLGARGDAAPAGLAGERLVYATGVPAAMVSLSAEPPVLPPAPSWLRTAVAPARRRRRRRPSETLRETPAGAGGDDRARARAMGRHVHALLERLPAVAPDARDVALKRYLELCGDVDVDLARRIRAQARAILDAPELAPLFDKAAWAEQPLVGMIDGVEVSGRIDRMAVVGDELWICDFKTGRPPRADARPAAAHVAQLGTYAALARPLFADLRVRARIVWTENGLVQTLDDEDLVTHMLRPRD